MKKFLTLLFAFTCLAFSEMRGQVTFGFYNSNNYSEVGLSSTDGVHFSGEFVQFSNANGFGYFFYNLDGSNYAVKYAYNFPTGTAIDYNGVEAFLIPPGNYLVQYNKVTQQFSFTGGSYRTFDDYGISESSCNKLSVYLSSAFSSFQWKRNGVAIPGATNSEYVHPANLPDGEYVYSCDAFSTDSSAVISSNSISLSNPIPLSVLVQNANDYCITRQLKASFLQSGSDWTIQWKKDGQSIPGATMGIYNAPPLQQASTYTFLAYCPNNNVSTESNAVSVPGCFGDSTSGINYLLVQNVTTTGNNASNKTIQVQFDLSWGNTWWDNINWDAAWVFMKYKTATGEWKHAKINPNGYDHGLGSPNIIQPTADKMGAFIRLGLKGQGNFNAEGMQLQWNYGLDGLSSVNGLEVKVFATEMVYQPQGDFSLSTNLLNRDLYFQEETGSIVATGNNIAIINSRLSPALTGNGLYLKIKGDAGLDLNADGTIDNQIFPTGYQPFYLFKTELSEQQYADFLNCLNSTQIGSLGIAGTSISLNQGAYYASFPNRACKGANPDRLLAYADWSGLRPMTVLELNKAFNGPNSPNSSCGYFQSSSCYDCKIPKDASGNQGSGFYGCKDLNGNVWEPVIRFGTASFVPNNGNGALQSNGLSDQSDWTPDQIRWGNFLNCYENYQRYPEFGFGFRLCRSAE